MIAPYYERDGIAIYHGDCREVLPQLVPSGVDLVVTDPPYTSLDEHVSRGTTTRLVAGGDEEWFPTLSDDEIVEILQGWCAQMLPLGSGAMYVFGDVKSGLRIFPRLNPRNVLVWDKRRIGMGYSWRRMHEWIAYCPDRDHVLRDKGAGDIIRCPGVETKTHPTEKPIALMNRLIANSSDAGEIVLDPFMGTGSTLRAAAQLGRRAIGIEVSERYCAKAVELLEATQAVLL